MMRSATGRHLDLAGQSPPATVMSVPVTYDASGEISHDTAFAISSGRPILPSGLCCTVKSRTSGVEADIAVSMAPGETLLDRMPSDATSLDRPRANVTKAPLGASYGTTPQSPGGAWAASQAIFTTDPPFPPSAVHTAPTAPCARSTA